MADIGDPLCDLGYIELLWQMPVSINSGPSSPTVDELAARYEELSGIPVHDRAWYRAFQTFKISIIQLVGAMLLDAGYSDDPRFAMMAEGTLLMTPMALHDLGVDEELDPGPVRPRRRAPHRGARPALLDRVGLRASRAQKRPATRRA